jgi:hypothetical protein
MRIPCAVIPVKCCDKWNSIQPTKYGIIRLFAISCG